MEDSQVLMQKLFERTLAVQEKMSDDIAEIKGSLKEASAIVGHLSENLDDVRTEHKQLAQKVEALEKAGEKHWQDCPARQRAQAWSFSLKDVLYVATMIGSIGAAIALLKG